MPRYKIVIPEVHHWTVEVVAKSFEEALEKAGHDYDKDLGTEYSHSLWEDLDWDEIEEKNE